MECKIWNRRTMKISISATNPCHLFALAGELSARGALGAYYSGYPAWKLGAASDLSLRTHSLRTNIVYGLLKFTIGLRLSQEEEYDGADLTVHKISSTPDREASW